MLDTDTCMAVSSMFASIILADLLQGPAEAVADSNVSNPVGFAPPLHRSERTILRNLAVYSLQPAFGAFPKKQARSPRRLAFGALDPAEAAS